LTLQATINLPTAADDPTEPQPPLAGFIHLVTVFRPFDDMFVALWNKTRSDCSPSYLAALQQQLTEALPTYLNSTESQAADLRVSQQWLRTMVWQLSIQNGCLSSSHENPSMTFQYPVEISRDLITTTSGFSHQSMEVHGVGLVRLFLPPLSTSTNTRQVEKLFDVACSLTDVLSLLPTPSDPFVLGPRDYLTQFLSLLSTLRNGDTRFLPLLLAKIHDVLPRLVSPMLQTLPETSAQMANVDIFDGFGNAGVGVAAGLPQHYDSKRIEEVDGQQRACNGNSSPDDGSFSSEGAAFVSPPIMTAAMEYPGMDAYAYLQGGGMQSARPVTMRQDGAAFGVMQVRGEYQGDVGYEQRSVGQGQGQMGVGMGMGVGVGVGVGELDRLQYR
jgi:hypothetical protein